MNFGEPWENYCATDPDIGSGHLCGNAQHGLPKIEAYRNVPLARRYGKTTEVIIW
jgi:hypothetical protein